MRQMALSRFVWRKRKAILLVIVFLCVVGAYFFGTLPVAIFPDLTAPRIIVTADAGDAPIPTVLANVTRPLESAIAGVPGIVRIGSLTQVGADELDVNFAWGADMPAALQLVNAKLAQTQPDLPAGVTVQAEQLNPSVFPIMGYSLYSSTIDPEDLRRVAMYTLRPRLLRVPGIQQVTIMGGDTPDYLVRVDPSGLAASGVSLADMENALAKDNEISSVGYYDQSFLHNEIIVSGRFKSAGDISNATVAVRTRVPITVGQIATVSRYIEPRTIETSGDGHDAVLVDVIKQPSGNTIAIADGIKAALAQARPDMPPGIVISNYYDQSQIVRESQSSVLEAIIVGGLLALIVLMLFLGNLRTAAVVLVILPLTIVITFGLMRLLGQTINIMTLGALAIALGLVIDDGIVVVENMYHELELGRSRRAAIAAGLQSITPAMLGSSVTTMAAFLPLVFLHDLTGQFFGPLALVMIATLAVSLTLALFLTPLLADILLPRSVAKSESGSHAAGSRGFLAFFPRQVGKLSLVYSRCLRWSLRHRVAVLALLVPIAIGGFLIAGRLQTGFFPEFDEGGFILDYQMPDGTSLAESSEVTHQIEGVLAHTPEVAAWSRRTGAQLGFDITTQNVGDMSVRLKRNRSRDIEAVMDDVRTQVDAEFPEAQADFHQILQDNIGDIAGSPSPVEIKIFGPDETELESLATQVDNVITKVPGVVDDFDGIVHSGPETVVNVDSARAQRYGLTTDDVIQAAQAALQGVEPTAIQEGDEVVGVRVQLASQSHVLDASTLENIRIDSPVTGGSIALGQVADIVRKPGTALVTRENQREMIAVTADLAGRDLGSATRQIQSDVARQVDLPKGYSIEYGGLYESQQQSFAELGLVLAVAVVLVFTLLVVQFHSLRQSIALLAAALLSLFGVVAALFVTRTAINIASFTGAIMIVGIITENGIVLFEFYNRLRAASPEADAIDLMIKAGEQRLRPILMTTLGAILALFPLALGIGAGAAMQKPLAIAVIGGLSISVFFTLIVAPVMYVAMEARKPPPHPNILEAEFAAVEAELARSKT
jgi:CzcA family heavy metal efflux pump